MYLRFAGPGDNPSPLPDREARQLHVLKLKPRRATPKKRD